MNNSQIILGIALKYGIDLALQVAEILASKETPSLEQWNALFERMRKSYDDYVKAP